jgi:hypothetical protein
MQDYAIGEVGWGDGGGGAGPPPPHPPSLTP